MRVTTIMLGGLGVILVGLIAFELRDAGMSMTKQGAEADAFHPNVVITGTSADVTAASVALVLARPLFSPARTAPAPAAAPGGTGPSALPRLSGIMISNVERDAVFTPNDGPPIIAGQGTRIGAFTVQSIQADSVTVSGPHGVSVLQTSFASVKVPAAAPPSSPFGAFGLSGATGSQWLDGGRVVLPNPATWPGPPMVRRLPVPQAPLASSPLLSPSGPPG